jgi:FKBP-type peptidyl-prolyl cis-trans isomerase
MVVMNVSIKGLMKPIRALFAASAVIGLFAVGACSQPPASAASSAPAPVGFDPEDIAHATFAPALNVHLDSMVRRPTGLYVRDLVTGNGPVATLGRSVVVRYTGWLADGKQIDSGEITVTLGSNKTIRAWEEGLLGIRAGGKRRMIVPPHMGYGAKGAGDGAIPPNSILVFEMDAISVF